MSKVKIKLVNEPVIGGRVRGFVLNHPRFAPDTYVITSEVVEVNLNEFRTKSGTEYIGVYEDV